MNNLPQHPDDLRDECRRVGNFGPAMAAYETLYVFFVGATRNLKTTEEQLEDAERQLQNIRKLDDYHAKKIRRAAGVTT